MMLVSIVGLDMVLALRTGNMKSNGGVRSGQNTQRLLSYCPETNSACRSICLGPDDASSAWLSCKNARAWLSVTEWNTSDTYAQLFIDTFLDVRVAAEVGPCESSMRRRGVAFWGGEVRAKGIFRVNLA